MNAYNQILDLFVVIAGAYMLYWAITGKGTLYKSENIKKGMEEKYKKVIKWFCLSGGVLAVLFGVLDYMRIEPIATALFVILCVIVVLVSVIIVGFTDHKKIKKSQIIAKEGFYGKKDGYVSIM